MESTNLRQENRLQRVAINYNTLLRAIRGEVRITHSTVPDDAKILNVFHDAPSNAIGVVLEHESFEVVPFGATIPILLDAYIEELGPRCEVLHTALLLIDRVMTIPDFQRWTIAEREHALYYAGALHLHASDNDDVIVPPIPRHVDLLPTADELNAPTPS